MLPALPPPDGSAPTPDEPARRAILRTGASLIFAALAALGYVLWRGPVTSAAGAIAGGTLTSVTGSWIMDPASSIGFSGNHAGNDFHGVPLHEETLPQAEWFNVAKYPKAEFKTTRVSADGAIEGTLTIKDRPLPVTGLKAAVDKGVLHITGKFDIARKDADLGQESDAGGDYVSLKIGVDVNARRAQFQRHLRIDVAVIARVVVLQIIVTWPSWHRVLRAPRTAASAI